MTGRHRACFRCAEVASHVCRAPYSTVYLCGPHAIEHAAQCEYPVRALDAPSLAILATNLANYGGGAD